MIRRGEGRKSIQATDGTDFTDKDRNKFLLFPICEICAICGQDAVEDGLQMGRAWANMFVDGRLIFTRDGYGRA
jgi:hypothetical protein